MSAPKEGLPLVSRYRKVLVRFWSDEKVKPLPLETKALLIYHLTSPHSTPFLLYTEGTGCITDTLKLKAGKLRDGMAALVALDIVWYADDGSDLIFLPRALLHAENAPTSSNELTTWLRLFHERVPRTPFRARCLAHWRTLGLGIPRGLARDFVDAVQGDRPAPEILVPRPPPVETGPIAAVIAEYQRLFEKKFGSKPTLNRPHDPITIKQLLGSYSLPALLDLVGAFFESDDAWIKGSAYSVGAFRASVNKLITRRRRAEVPSSYGLNLPG